MFNQPTLKNLADYEKRYKKYFDAFESKSVLARTGKRITENDLAVLGAQLEQFESWKTFQENNGSADDLGAVPRIALDKQVA